MIIRTIPVTPFEQNARVVTDEVSAESIVVDPGGEVERIMQLIDEYELCVRYIVLTHCHIDHAGGAAGLLARLAKSDKIKTTLLAHRGEDKFRSSISEQAMMFGLSPQHYENVPEFDSYLENGQEISFGELGARVMHVPGHSPGHVALYFESGPVRTEIVDKRGGARVELKSSERPVLISGDVLFAGSVGRADLPGGDYRALINSIRSEIFVLNDSTLVMSGHGPDTSVGEEKKTNPFLRDN